MSTLIYYHMNNSSIFDQIGVFQKNDVFFHFSKVTRFGQKVRILALFIPLRSYCKGQLDFLDTMNTCSSLSSEQLMSITLCGAHSFSTPDVAPAPLSRCVLV